MTENKDVCLSWIKVLTSMSFLRSHRCCTLLKSRNAHQSVCNILGLLESPERISMALPPQTGETETKLVPIDGLQKRTARRKDNGWKLENSGKGKVICLLVRQDVCSFGKIKYTLSGRLRAVARGWKNGGAEGHHGGCWASRDIWDNMRTRHICWDIKRQTLSSNHSATR